MKDIVSYFHRSIKASDELEKIQKQLSLPEHHLIQDVETRWNSTYFMFERYIEQHTAITTALCLLNQNSLCISNNELEVIKATIMALKPLKLLLENYMYLVRNICQFLKLFHLYSNYKE